MAFGVADSQYGRATVLPYIKRFTVNIFNIETFFFFCGLFIGAVFYMYTSYFNFIFYY